MGSFNTASALEYCFNCDSKATEVYSSYHIYTKMKIVCWYRSGSLETFYKFCAGNQGKTISIKLINRSEPVRGALYSYCIDPPEAGLFLLLTDRVIHSAYYGLEDIENLHIGLNETWIPALEDASSEDRSSSEISSSEVTSSRDSALLFAQ
jgi:hypothetical protein